MLLKTTRNNGFSQIAKISFIKYLKFFPYALTENVVARDCRT
jgi:hypothetical protein